MFVLIIVIATSGALFSACGGGGGGGSGGPEDKDLIVVEMALVDQVGNPTGSRGTTNAYRNNRILLTFSAPVEMVSVDDRTVQIGIPSTPVLFLKADGRYTVDGNEVLFDPTVTSTGAPNPFGFLPDSDYTLIVPGLPAAKTVTSVADKQVASTFRTTFHTSDQYLPDLDQPRAVSVAPAGLSSNDIAELLQMTPEERIQDNADSQQLDTDGNNVPGTGKWEQVWVDSKADVVVDFTEAMLPATFDPDVSFRVVNLDRGGRDVLGVFRYSDDATEVTMRPTFGYGRGPYLIQVTLTVDITDLAENPIGNPQTWTFLTEYDPTAVNEGLFEEHFEDNLYEDTAFQGPNGEAQAQWNDPANPGRLTSVFGVSAVKIPANQGATAGVFPPIGTGSWANSRAQCLYTGAEINQAAGTITQVYWHSYTGYTASNNVWTGLTIKLGMSSQATLTSTFASNFNVGSPATIASNVTYTVPSNNGNVYLLLPTTGNFSYNGTDGLVLDIAKSNSTASSSAAWSFVYSFTGRYCYGTPSTATGGSLVTYWTFAQFGFRTEHSMAQSLWYRADSADPMYLEPVLSPTEHPAGTEASLQFQGAIDDGNGAPDAATFSQWVDDPADLDGHEFMRFQVKFTANLASGVGPYLEDILLPYIFF